MSFLSLFLASLVGSPHCVGMCGGLVGYVSGRSQNKAYSQALYHSGRISVYVLLGALAGAFGSSLDQVGVLVGIQKTAPLLVAVFLFAQALFIFWKPAFLVTGAGKKVQDKMSHLLHSAVRNISETRVAFTLGALTAFLPCGWLYSFVVFAIASGSALHGGLTLLAFGLGTLPALVLLGTTVRTLLHRTGFAAKTVTAGLLIVAGAFSLGQHLGVFKSHSHHSHCEMKNDHS